VGCVCSVCTVFMFTFFFVFFWSSFFVDVCWAVIGATYGFFERRCLLNCVCLSTVHRSYCLKLERWSLSEPRR